MGKRLDIATDALEYIAAGPHLLDPKAAAAQCRRLAGKALREIAAIEAAKVKPIAGWPPPREAPPKFDAGL